MRASRGLISEVNEPTRRFRHEGSLHFPTAVLTCNGAQNFHSFHTGRGHPRYTDRPINSAVIICSPIPTPNTFLSKDTLLERIHHPPGFPVISKPGKMLHQNGQPRPRDLLVQDRSRDGDHVCAPSPNQSAHGITAGPSIQNYPQSPVNLSSLPWVRTHLKLTPAEVVARLAQQRGATWH